MCVELTCQSSGRKIEVVKANVCHWTAAGESLEDGSCVHMVCGKCLCVKECPDTIHKLFHEHK